MGMPSYPRSSMKVTQLAFDSRARLLDFVAYRFSGGLVAEVRMSRPVMHEGNLRGPKMIIYVCLSRFVSMYIAAFTFKYNSPFKPT